MSTLLGGGKKKPTAPSSKGKMLIYRDLSVVPKENRFVASGGDGRKEGLPCAT